MYMMDFDEINVSDTAQCTIISCSRPSNLYNIIIPLHASGICDSMKVPYVALLGVSISHSDEKQNRFLVTG